MNKGGFDIAIGNPPYVEYRTIIDSYSVRGFTTEKCGNLFAMVMERSIRMVKVGHVGMIVPVSGSCADGYAPLRGLLLATGDIVVSHFNDRPSRLFDGIEHNRLSIFLLKIGGATKKIFSTTYNKWQSLERDTLFQRLAFVDATKSSSEANIPKLGHPLESSIVDKFQKAPIVATTKAKMSNNKTIYYTRKLSYFVQIIDFVPVIYDRYGNLRKPSELKEIKFESQSTRDGVLAFLKFVTVLLACDIVF